MRYLALDVGERRTGVAVGELLARPLTTLRRRSKTQDFAAIARLIQDHQVDVLVVGLPLNMDGSMGFQAQRTARYAERLREALAKMSIDVELVFWDERLTTERAKEIMRSAEHSRRDRQQRLDAIAAATILQSYLDERVDEREQQNKRDCKRTET
jgi:putative Holliday junction resolvase